MRRIIGLLLILSLVVGAALASAAGATEVPKSPKGTLEVVGHDPLKNRGMNSALAVHGDYAYVGSRTDGKANNVNGAGVLVVDVSDPSKPKVVHEIALPHEGHEGETSREMRIWPQQDLLIVMNLGSNCSYLIHACSPRTVADNYRFYDISGKHGAKPKLVAEYKPSMDPHEFYLWVDPKRPSKRALMFQSAPSDPQTLFVTDISDARKGKFKEIAAAGVPAEAYVHSMATTPDGKRIFLAHNEGGFFVADTSQVIAGKKKPVIKVLTSPKNAPDWEGQGALHSAVPLFGKDFVLTTDEAYGDALRALGSGGCPWGWTRLVDTSNPAKPKVVSEYKIPENDQSYCTAGGTPKPSTSFSAHNPTLTKHLAFISWHSGGLQVVDITNPRKPVQAAEWKPTPLPYVLQEDPALSAGAEKVVTWSYPIIQDGLIYVTDVRNGLHILRYKGPYASEVNKVDFIEGNSNLGDAQRF